MGQRQGQEERHSGTGGGVAGRAVDSDEQVPGDARDLDGSSREERHAGARGRDGDQPSPGQLWRMDATDPVH